MNFAPLRFAPAVLLITASLLAPARADVRLPAIFGDHMVLQQDIKIPVWGWADPGERITVTLGTRQAQTTADATGNWRVNLDPVRTVAEAVTLTVAGKNTLMYKDILVGDVWLASGQSNMEYDFQKGHTAREDMPKADHPQIRFFQIPRTNRLEPQTNVTAKWVVCTPESVRGFSAIGYYFAREISQTQKRPVGVIGTYWGGTPVQSWISLEALKQPPAFTGSVQNFERQYESYLKNKDAYPQALKNYIAARDAWNAEVKPAFDAANKAWGEAAKAAKTAGQPEPPKPQPSRPAPREIGNPLGGPGTATSLYNGMIAPLIPYGIKGALWYQGESDAGNPGSGLNYAGLFARMITDWRTRWGQGDFPFLYVQLANFHAPATQPVEGPWAWVRESQRLTLKLPATGMASAVDIGDANDIHPKDKKDLGLRLAQAAKAIAYGEKVTPMGPVYNDLKVENRQIRISFNHTGSGLVLGTPPWTPDGKPRPEPTKLTGFAIAGADQKWVWADAKIDGQTVIVSSPEVTAPVAVRYGWADNPAINLYNKEGLPASPFRTDDWKP